MDLISVIDVGLFRLSVSSPVSFGRLCLFKKLIYFIKMITFGGILLFIVFLLDPFNSHWICSDDPLYFHFPLF